MKINQQELNKICDCFEEESFDNDYLKNELVRLINSMTIAKENVVVISIGSNIGKHSDRLDQIIPSYAIDISKKTPVKIFAIDPLIKDKFEAQKMIAKLLKENKLKKINDNEYSYIDTECNTNLSICPFATIMPEYSNEPYEYFLSPIFEEHLKVGGNKLFIGNHTASVLENDPLRDFYNNLKKKYKESIQLYTQVGKGHVVCHHDSLYTTDEEELMHQYDQKRFVNNLQSLVNLDTFKYKEPRLKNSNKI